MFEQILIWIIKVICAVGIAYTLYFFYFKIKEFIKQKIKDQQNKK